jgi:DNA-binding PadR family transcriptional regulator
MARMGASAPARLTVRSREWMRPADTSTAPARTLHQVRETKIHVPVLLSSPGGSGSTLRRARRLLVPRRSEPAAPACPLGRTARSRLAKLGYLATTTEPGRTHPRTVYGLTAQGRSALQSWLATAAHFPRIKNEAHLRLLAGDLLTDEQILQSFRGMLPELDDLEAVVEAMYAQADRVPARTRYLRLSHAYARKLVHLHREWIADIEAELTRRQQ